MAAFAQQVLLEVESWLATEEDLDEAEEFDAGLEEGEDLEVLRSLLDALDRSVLPKGRRGKGPKPKPRAIQQNLFGEDG
ncbi:MAG: hypothetical protein HY900_26155 [Deltaproteobacteria bacterium]|nr:hypothetical protein [Deltaproteobacteria bacterium]